MKLSVVVIAHNEEKYIGRCIESILDQSRRPDEIIVVSHNSTDQTSAIANQYAVAVDEYTGPSGSAHARIRGFELATGDIVLCIDGDAHAAPSWARTLSKILEQKSVTLVGSWVRLSGSLFARMASLCWYAFTNVQGQNATTFLYGASYGVRGEDRAVAIKALTESILLSERFSLPYNPDDYWLALFMIQRGDVIVTNKTWVTARSKESNSWEFMLRSYNAQGVVNKIRVLLKHSPLPALN